MLSPHHLFLLLPLQHLHSTHGMHIHSCHHLVFLFSTSQSLLLWVLVLINCICFQLTFTWAPFIYHNVEARLWKSQNRYKKQRETRIIIVFICNLRENSRLSDTENQDKYTVFFCFIIVMHSGGNVDLAWNP